MAVAALTLSGCGSPGAAHTGTSTGPGGRALWTPQRAGARLAVDTGTWGASAAAPCAGTDPSGCMLPFPNDYDTAPDAATPTGRHIAFPAAALPRATGAAALDPTPWEANDGFSPGSVLLTHVPALSLRRSGLATISNMGDSLRTASPVVLLDTDTGQRWPTWAELDANDHDPATQLLMIHPAQDLAEGQHYIVALRNLRDGGGAPIRPNGAFAAALADRSAPHAPGAGATVAPAYAAHLRQEAATLARHGVSSAGLFLAWDFTVDSERNLTTPELTMRDRAFAQLGSAVPQYTVTKVVNDPPDNPSLAREVTGRFSTPSFLNEPGGPDGSVLNLGADGLPAPTPGNTQVTNFDCEIPKAATASHPAHVGIYGHGLFNSSAEVYASSVPQFSDAHDYVFCGTDWLGLSGRDLNLAVSVVTNLDGFPSLVDHLMQSLVDAQFLGRLMDDPAGFAANAAFAEQGHPVIDARSSLVYYGNSEGGIMGGAFIALSTDARRAVLGVPGMNYAVLLPRSADFSPFQTLLDHAYPSEATQQLGFDIIQMLWDRGEAEGYVEQMTGGLPGTPSHQVLMGEAFGDHQVANVATETEARTIGAAIHQPTLRPGRSNERVAYWDLPALRPRWLGPALFVWDSGVPPAPLGDDPPTKGPDPHDTVPRSLPAFWGQMSTFFSTGKVTDPCGSAGCRAPKPSSSS